MPRAIPLTDTGMWAASARALSSFSACDHHTVPPAITDGLCAFSDQLGCALDEVRVGRSSQVSGQVLGGFGHVRGTEEDIQRHIHEHRAGAPAERRAHRFQRRAGMPLRQSERLRLLGHRLQNAT